MEVAEAEAVVEPETESSTTVPEPAPEGTATTPEPEPSTAEPESGASGSETDAEATEPRPSPAEVEERVRIENARRHYEQGYVLWNQGRYLEAANEYELSYAAVPAARALYSAGLSYERAGKAVDAVRTMRRYLELPQCTADSQARDITCASRRDEAQELLDEQLRLVGELRLDLAEGVTLLEVRVAGRTVPQDEFPLLLRPGPVDVEMFGEGPEQHRARVAYITAGEPFTLYVAPFITEEAPSATGEPDEAALEAERRRAVRRQRILKTTFWSGVGLTAGSGVALALFGGLTLRAYRTFKQDRCAAQCVDPETGLPLGSPENDLYPHQARADFERFKPIANVFVGVTVGLGVATALVGAFAFRRRDTEQSPATARVRVRGPGLVVRW